MYTPKDFFSHNKPTLNEAISLNPRELLHFPFTEFLKIPQRNLCHLRTEINAMISSKEQSREQVKRKTEQN